MPPITALSPSPPSPTLVTALIRKPSLASSNSSDPSDDTDDDQEEDDDASAPNIDQAKERLRVLEVAGVLVRAEKQNQDTADPPRVRRRPPPAPLRNHDDTERMREDIVVESPEERLGREEDAYAIYQRVMRDLPPLPDRHFEAIPATARLSPSLAPSESRRPSSFLSRVGLATGLHVGSVAGTKTRPIVSGPVGVGVEGERRTATFIGSTWSSLIDSSVLAEIPDRERKRQESIFEFIATESTFLSSLQLIVQVFMPALHPPVISEKAFTVIFAKDSIERILLYSVMFLSALEDRQQSCRLFVDAVGDIIADKIVGVEVFQAFCVNQRNSGSTLQGVKNASPDLVTLLDSLKVNGLELEHYLLEVLQRLARYPLLIGQILRYTDEDHPDYRTLTEALQTAETVLSSTNEMVRSAENNELMLFLSSLELSTVDARLDLTTPTRFGRPRSLIKEGKLTKSKGSGRILTLYLFSDLLLFTEKKHDRESIYRLPIPLEECSLRKDQRDDTSFLLMHRGDSIRLKEAGSRACSNWIKEIAAARDTYLTAIAESRRR